MVTRFADSLARHLSGAKEARPRSHALTPINSIFGLLGPWFGPEVALNWLFPYPLMTHHLAGAGAAARLHVEGGGGGRAAGVGRRHRSGGRAGAC